MSNITDAIIEKFKSSRELPISTISDLKAFKNFCGTLNASQRNYPDGLDEWIQQTHGFVRLHLKNVGFVNALPSSEQTEGAQFWFKFMRLLGSIVYSPHLVTNVAREKSTAAERNNALILSLQDIIDAIEG